jgi:hypothetical protein
MFGTAVVSRTKAFINAAKLEAIISDSSISLRSEITIASRLALVSCASLLRGPRQIHPWIALSREILISLSDALCFCSGNPYFSGAFLIRKKSGPAKNQQFARRRLNR